MVRKIQLKVHEYSMVSHWEIKENFNYIVYKIFKNTINKV